MRYLRLYYACILLLFVPSFFDMHGETHSDVHMHSEMHTHICDAEQAKVLSYQTRTEIVIMGECAQIRGLASLAHICVCMHTDSLSLSCTKIT